MNAHVIANNFNTVARNTNIIADTSRLMANNAKATTAHITATVDRIEESNELYRAALLAMKENRMDDYRSLKAQWVALEA